MFNLPMASSSDLPSAPPEAEEILRRLLAATASGDYEAYLAPGTDRFKEGVSGAMFEGVRREVAPRLQAGHTIDFLAQMGNCEHRVYLWKIVFTDGGQDYVARVVLTEENQVAGFMLN